MVQTNACNIDGQLHVARKKMAEWCVKKVHTSRDTPPKEVTLLFSSANFEHNFKSVMRDYAVFQSCISSNWVHNVDCIS